MSEIKAGAILNYCSLFLRLGVSFFLSPFILSHLGPGEFGVYTIAGTIVGWLAICDFGLTASTTKFVSEYQARGDAEGEAHYLGNVAALFSIIGLAVMAAGLCIYPFLDSIFDKFTSEQMRLYRILYLMTLFNTALMFPARSLGGISSARQKYKIPGIVGFFVQIASITGTVVVLLLGYRAIALSAVSISLGVIGLIWNVWYCFGILKAKMTWSGWDIPLCRSMFSFSIWMFLDRLVNILNTGSSNFIVGMTKGAAEIAVYSYGLQLFNIFFMVSGCIAGLFLPRVVNRVVNGASNEEQTDMMISLGRIQFILIGVMYFGIIFFGEEFFRLWLGKTLGERTHDCWFVAVTIMLPYGFLLLQALGWQIMQARNVMRYRVTVLTVTSAFSLIVGYILCLYWGTRSLAVGTALSVCLGQGLFVNWYYWKRMGLNIPLFFVQTLRRIWLVIPLLCVSGLLLNMISGESCWSVFFLKITVFSIVYGLVVMLFYANATEKKLLKETLFLKKI